MLTANSSELAVPDREHLYQTPILNTCGKNPYYGHTLWGTPAFSWVIPPSRWRKTYNLRAHPCDNPTTSPDWIAFID